MLTEQQIYSESNGWEIQQEVGIAEKAQLVLLFGNRNLLKNKVPVKDIELQYPNAQIVGCSTSGEIINQEVFDERIICTAIWFEKSTIVVRKEDVHSMKQSYEVGQRLGESLEDENLKHVMIISEGLNINGTELTSSLNQVFENRVPITGGLAGDQALFEETVIVYNGEVRANMVVAIGFYGDSLQFGYGSMGGWSSFGVDREVTRSESNILYELDGQPALELYKKYLGDHARNLPASALLFPLSLRIDNNENPLVRTVLSVNEEDGSMVFAGDIQQGEIVRLMMANFNHLINGASDAAEMASLSLNQSNADLAILISCVGRKLVLKQRVEQELEVIQNIIGDNVATTGFYSYGEICPMKPFEQHCELHNQTMTITLIKEN